MKNLTVKSADWTLKITIDEKIHDDIYIEACTQAIEQLYNRKELRLAPVIECIDNTSKSYIYNSYKLLINAGYHNFADIFRKKLLKDTKIDWYKEPLKSNL